MPLSITIIMVVANTQPISIGVNVNMWSKFSYLLRMIHLIVKFVPHGCLYVWGWFGYEYVVWVLRNRNSKNSFRYGYEDKYTIFIIVVKFVTLRYVFLILYALIYLNIFWSYFYSPVIVFGIGCWCFIVRFLIIWYFILIIVFSSYCLISCD